jgi:hypothetical protein
MPAYELFIRGESFRSKTDDAVKLIGFYTTRWIEAVDEVAAESKVIADLREQLSLQKPDWHDGSPPHATVYVENIAEIISGWDGKPGIGFVWFDEGSQ